ncbi:amino acid ABC transporter permease [Mesorhizobium sp. WSM4887]|uniref:amino acid ABC transporter permease n=1 Tax=Mesorhizobium sp. WSM4887 TaxID=3038543 RepID=UPI0024175536|nr:amino acid ABC transporter permease [Mesorhizobium sp. WSM4887]MDG4889845.1 amino acid ABC transporter permease [Mesorhizobium sp. WSM4887]
MTTSILDFWPVFLKGVATTLWISWLGLILGGLLGALVGMAADSRSRILRAFAMVYTELFRSIPPLILFFGCFYGISFAFKVDLSPFTSATIALALEASAFMAGVVSAGIASVGRGQWEAAQASGMNFWQIMRYVIGPQAIRVMLPPTVGVYIGTLKDSSLASVIGFVELTKSGLLVREASGASFQAFLVVGLLYFLINYSISLIGAALERKFHIAK